MGEFCAILGGRSSHDQRNCIARIDGVPALVRVDAEVGPHDLFVVPHDLFALLHPGEDCDATDFLFYVAALLLAVLRLAAGLVVPKLLAVSRVKVLVFGAHDHLVQGADG